MSSSIDSLTNSAFASAIKVLGRSSERAAAAAAERADQISVPERALGREIKNDGFVDVREMGRFAVVAGGIGQGLTAEEKRLGQAAGILNQALLAPAVPMQVTSSAPRAEWQKEISVAGLTGNVEVRNTMTNKLVLSADRKQLAQRIAGPGQQTIGPDDFQKALQFLTPDERYLANQLFNELYFSKPLGTFTQQLMTPGGHALHLETVQVGEGLVPTGGINVANMGQVVDRRITPQFTVELKLTPREVLVDAANGQTYVPDRNGIVRLPVGTVSELAIVTRGATGGVKEKFRLELTGGAAEDWMRPFGMR